MKEVRSLLLIPRVHRYVVLTGGNHQIFQLSYRLFCFVCIHKCFPCGYPDFLITPLMAA